jgi:hypothetical protein
MFEGMKETHSFISEWISLDDRRCKGIAQTSSIRFVMLTNFDSKNRPLVTAANELRQLICFDIIVFVLFPYKTNRQSNRQTNPRKINNHESLFCKLKIFSKFLHTKILDKANLPEQETLQKRRGQKTLKQSRRQKELFSQRSR